MKWNRIDYAYMLLSMCVCVHLVRKLCTLKYKIITLIGNKLRKQGFTLSIQLFGSQASTQIHHLLTEEDNPVVGKEVGVEFYDRDVGNILSCKLFYETTAAGTDLYVEKIAVQR